MDPQHSERTQPMMQNQKEKEKTNTQKCSLTWKDFKLNESGLVPCIVQDCHTGEVLMLAYMNEEAFQKTLESGGIPATVRRTLGGDIDASCGQLRRKYTKGN